MYLRSKTSLLALVSILVLAGEPANAHPHIFVTDETTLVFQDEALTALKVVWTFDEMYSAASLLEADADDDGLLSESELAALARETIGTLHKLAYFTSAMLGRRALKFAPPTDYGFRSKDGILAFHLTLPLEYPIAIGEAVFSFVTRDPGFMNAFSWGKSDPIKVEGDMPEGCTITTTLPEDQAAEISRLGAIFPLGGRSFGLSMAAVGSVHCGSSQ